MVTVVVTGSIDAPGPSVSESVRRLMLREDGRQFFTAASADRVSDAAGPRNFMHGSATWRFLQCRREARDGSGSPKCTPGVAA